jgi:hypothetical protein
VNEVLLDLHGGRRDGIRILHDREREVPLWLAFAVDIEPGETTTEARMADRYGLVGLRGGVVRYDWKERRPVPWNELFSSTADRII